MEEIAPMIMGVAMFWFIGWGIKAAGASRREARQSQLQADLQSRLLDKVHTSQELAEILDTEAGKAVLVAAPAERANPYAKILGSIQTGIVLSLAGVVFLVTGGWFPEGEKAMVFVGAMGLALGIGFLLSAAASLRLSRLWGLINGQRDEDRVA